MLQCLDAADLPLGIDAFELAAQDQAGAVGCAAAGAAAPMPPARPSGCS